MKRSPGTHHTHTHTHTHGTNTAHVTRHARAQTPLEDDAAYASAFVQVLNIWERDATVAEFVFGRRLARIAAELMQVRDACVRVCVLCVCVLC